jgi:hypothetical protein
MRDQELLIVRWYPVENDLIGGWSVMTVDKPPSQCDWSKGEIEVASFTGEAVARHIAELHNATLGES